MVLKLLWPVAMFSVAHILVGCATVPISKPHTQNGVATETIITDSGQTVHVATIDPKVARLKVIAAKTPSGLEKPSVLAKASDALVAINGGFFGSNGGPVGALKIDGHWVNRPTKLRGVVGFGPQGTLIFDRLRWQGKILHESDKEFAPDGWWDEVDELIGGAPLIVFDSQVIDPAPEATLSLFLENRYGRTAICRLPDNRIKLAVVNGGDRMSDKFWFTKGMSIAELAQFLVSLGCKEALNLDGGYSSSFVENGQRLNSFSVGFLPERSVANIIAVFK